MRLSRRLLFVVICFWAALAQAGMHSARGERKIRLDLTFAARQPSEADLGRMRASVLGRFDSFLIAGVRDEDAERAMEVARELELAPSGLEEIIHTPSMEIDPRESSGEDFACCLAAAEIERLRGLLGSFRELARDGFYLSVFGNAAPGPMTGRGEACCSFRQTLQRRHLQRSLSRRLHASGPPNRLYFLPRSTQNRQRAWEKVREARHFTLRGVEREMLFPIP